MREGVNTVLFDLDGTLLPMDQEVFIQTYFRHLAGHMAPLGYDPGQLSDAVWKGMAAMVRNDGTATNEQRFWQVFAEVLGERVLDDYGHFEEFYNVYFRNVRSATGFRPEAARLIKDLKEKGYRLILATNPIFPRAATEERIRWAGLDRDDFLLVTTYENSCWCKPDPRYFREILTKTATDARSCVMIGNDASEDLPAKTLGMEVFLLADDLINTGNIDLSDIPHGSYDKLRAWLGLA